MGREGAWREIILCPLRVGRSEGGTYQKAPDATLILTVEKGTTAGNTARITNGLYRVSLPGTIKMGGDGRLGGAELLLGSDKRSSACSQQDGNNWP